jgi:hypothetical protein
MAWIDIGMTMLLTLRIGLSRAALPQLLDPNNDDRLPEGKDEQQECLSVGDVEVNGHFPRESSSGDGGLSQLHIHVMPNSKVRR